MYVSVSLRIAVLWFGKINKTLRITEIIQQLFVLFCPIFLFYITLFCPETSVFICRIQNNVVFLWQVSVYYAIKRGIIKKIAVCVYNTNRTKLFYTL